MGLLEPCRPLALSLLADPSGPRDGERARMGRGVRDRVRAPGAVVGELDGASPAMKGSVARLSAIAGVALVASAHVGSPDTYFEGAAGPYPVRVIIRSPGVVPGLAQITVRLLAPHAVRRVLVLPVYWDPRTAAPPPPDVVPGRRVTLRARIAMTVGAVVLAFTLLGGRAWWNAVDAAYRTGLYQPLHATATVRPAGGAGGRVLRLAIDDTSWTSPKRQWTPLVPDHGHLMHLFLVRDATLDAFAHLHPLPLDSTTFESSLPPLEPGRYRAYADIVHESGFSQTLVTTLELGAPPGAWRATDQDDAWIGTPGNGKGETGDVVRLADGSTMTWERGAAPMTVDEEAPLQFTVTD